MWSVNRGNWEFTSESDEKTCGLRIGWSLRCCFVSVFFNLTVESSKLWSPAAWRVDATEIVKIWSLWLCRGNSGTRSRTDLWKTPLSIRQDIPTPGKGYICEDGTYTSIYIYPFIYNNIPRLYINHICGGGTQARVGNFVKEDIAIAPAEANLQRNRN